MSLALTDRAGRYDEAAFLRWVASFVAVIALHVGVALAIILPWHSSFDPPKPPPAVFLDLPPLVNSVPSPKPPAPVPPATPPRQPLPEQKTETSPPPPPPPPPPKQPEKEPAPQRQLMTVPQAPAVTPPRPKPEPPKAATQQPEKPPPVTAAPRAYTVNEWQLAVVQELEKYKVWPPGMTHGQTPKPVGLSITIDRQGNILAFAIARSSGDPQFDAAALSMAKRARRLPPLPPELTGQIYRFVLAIQFY